MSMQINLAIDLNFNRCWHCGRVYYFEGSGGHTCPKCAPEDIRKLNDRIELLNRRIAGLKGCVRRLGGGE